MGDPQRVLILIDKIAKDLSLLRDELTKPDKERPPDPGEEYFERQKELED